MRVAAALLAIVAAWPSALAQLTFTSRSGASVSVASMLQYVAPPETDEPRAFSDLRVDPSSRLLEACSAPCTAEGQGFVLIVRTSDFPPPTGTKNARVRDTSIGLTYAALLRNVHADAYFAGKNIVRARNGDVVMVELTDQDPPPARYDHGFRSTTFHAYALRDGVVVAHAYHYTEN